MRYQKLYRRLMQTNYIFRVMPIVGLKPAWLTFDNSFGRITFSEFVLITDIFTISMCWFPLMVERRLLIQKLPASSVEFLWRLMGSRNPTNLLTFDGVSSYPGITIHHRRTAGCVCLEIYCKLDCWLVQEVRIYQDNEASPIEVNPISKLSGRLWSTSVSWLFPYLHLHIIYKFTSIPSSQSQWSNPEGFW